MPKSQPVYRIDVVPLTPLYGRRDPRFSYVSPVPIPTGSLVSISFGKRILTGVALASGKLAGPVPDWMKFIGPVLLPAWLTEYQISLAWELSERLYTPLGIVFKLFFPLQRKPRGKKSPNEDEIPSPLSKKLGRLVRTVEKQLTPLPPTNIGVANDTELFEQLKKLSRKALREKKLILILVPEVLTAELYTEKIAHIFPDVRIRCLSSRRTSKEAHLIYEAISQNALDIVVGTRQAVFAPFGKLSAVAIVDAEKQLSYSQWEMAPRYNAVEIAESLARVRQIPCLKLSVAPGIEYFASDIPLDRIGTPFAFSAQHRLIPIDLRKTYRRDKTNQPLSLDLITALRQAKAQKESVLILVKQRGLSRFSLCAKCQSPQRCPSCAAALSEGKDGRFRCLSCGYQSGLFPICGNCGHMHFKSFGAGTQAIERALQREGLADSPLVIDRDAQSLRQGFQKLVAALSDPDKPLTIVATYESAYSLPLPPLGIIALIEPDQGLFYPDFQSEERLWRELRRFGGKLMTGGRLLVQTFEPEKAYWTTWVQAPLKVTADALLDERRTLHYPPYYRLIQLDCHPKKDLTSLQVAEQVEATLRKLTLPTVDILPKYLPFSRKNRYHVLIRYPRDMVFPTVLATSLSALDPSVYITHNPLSLHG